MLTSGYSLFFRVGVNIKGAWILTSHSFLQVSWHRARIALDILSWEAEHLPITLNVKCQGRREYRWTKILLKMCSISLWSFDLPYFTCLFSLISRSHSETGNNGFDQDFKVAVNMESGKLYQLRFYFSFLLSTIKGA